MPVGAGGVVWTNNYYGQIRNYDASQNYREYIVPICCVLFHWYCM